MTGAPVPVRVLCARTIANVSPGLSRALSLDPGQNSIALLATDCDDVTYLALDEATKAANVSVVYGRSLYAGAGNAPTPLTGEVVGILAGPTPADVRSGLAAALAFLQDGPRFREAENGVVYRAHCAARTGTYLSRAAHIPAGQPLAYLIAPPVPALLLANLAAIPMQDSAIPLLSGLVPILVILGLELILAAVSLRSIRMRRLLCGKPVILMQNGKILERNLQRTRVNLDELTMHLREKGIFDLSTVKFAILETNGQLSTLLYAKEQPASARDAGIRVRETELPVTIISAGRILAENLHLAGRDGGWLEAELKRRSLTAEQVLLLTVDAAGTVYLVRKEDLA